jgi:hypothetical protein
MPNTDTINATAPCQRERLEKFTTAAFLTQPKLLFTTAAKAERLRESTAEALFYFYSNQFDKITAQHIADATTLYEAAGKKAETFLKPPLVLTTTEAPSASGGAILRDNLQQLTAECRREDFASHLLAQAIAGSVSLISPFSGNSANCQESYELKIGITCLRFTDGSRSFFLLQEISSADGLFFPEENILITITSAASYKHAAFLVATLLDPFQKSVDYAQVTHLFAGVIASHHRPAHFYYEILPSLIEISRQTQISAALPGFITRRNQDFIDLGALFPTINNTVLDSKDIKALALTENKWFLCAGTSRHLRPHNHCFHLADRYLVSEAIKNPTPAAQDKAEAVAACYPLVWIGVEGQKRCWLEQVDGYAYILNRLAAQYPKLGVVIDGWTLPFSPSEKSLADVADDERVAAQLLTRLNPAIKHTLLVGEHSNTKLYLGDKVDFFICNFSTGSMHVSRMLGKPGFCHLSVALSEVSLRMAQQIHPNPHVYLLPRQHVHDKPDQHPAFSLNEIKKPKKLLLKSLKSWRARLGLSKIAPSPLKIGALSYSIDKQVFYDFIAQRLAKVLANRPPAHVRLFIEPSFTVASSIRSYLRMAAHGNLIFMFPVQQQIRQLADLADCHEDFLRQQLIYTSLGFGPQNPLDKATDYLVWLRHPRQRLKLHFAQLAKSQIGTAGTPDTASLLRKGFKGLDNLYTRMLSGQDAPFGQCTEAMLAVALQNLAEHFVFIGINEQTASSFDRLCALMDWDRTLFPEQLADTFHVQEAVFDDADAAFADELIKLDLRLYQAALRMAEKTNPSPLQPPSPSQPIKA